MRLLVCAVGKLKAGPERALFDHYRERFLQAGRGVHLSDLDERELAESRAATSALRRADEARRLLDAIAGTDVVVALDERGRAFSSRDFASWLGRCRDDGAGAVAFVLGGPDGQGDDLRAAANLTLSLGALTLPHGLARVVLAEQLYRSATILARHPYHRD